MIKQNEKDGTWIVSYAKRHPITRMPKSLRRIGIKTRAEAQRVYAELIVQVEESLHAQMVPKWSEHVEKFRDVSRERGLAERTVENYWLHLKAHTFEAWGNRLIDSISTQEIRELIPQKVGHRSASQQKNLLKFVRAAFNYAVESNILQRNPCPQMKFKVGEKIKTVLTEEQVRLFLNAAKEQDVEWYLHWALAVYTGMRNGELYALTWDKVNLEDRRIVVDSSWNNRDGFKPHTKSYCDRVIEIAPNIGTILRELRLQNPDSHFVLPRIDKWDKGEQARELRMFLMGMGLPAIRFHDLRATWATILLTKGKEPIKVMSMAGWKDLKTMAFYIRKAGVNIKGITDCLDLHNPSTNPGKVLQFKPESSEE